MKGFFFQIQISRSRKEKLKQTNKKQTNKQTKKQNKTKQKTKQNKKKKKKKHSNYGKICAGKPTFSCYHHQDMPLYKNCLAN